MASDRAVSILHVFPSFAIGGQQRRLASLAAAFVDEFSHKILSLDGETGAAALFEREKPEVDTLILEKSGFVRTGNIARLKRKIAESGADILCTYNFGSIEAAIANRLGPRLARVHHEDGFGPDEAGDALNWKRSFARRVTLSDAIVVVPSKSLERIATRQWGVAEKRLRRIPVGVDGERFKARRQKSGGAIVVGAVGALRKEKNFERLIRCFEIAREGYDARLAIYGDGPERQNLEKRASSSKAREFISLPGATSTVADVLAGFDIFALSSDTEQMPTSLLEAMACGLPAIATSVGDVSEMLGTESRNFVVARDDEEAFAAGLRRLISDEALRTALGAANLERVRNYGIEPMVEAFRQVYRVAAETER